MDKSINGKYDLTKEVVLLVDKGIHKIYWVGTTSEKALRSNIYLIIDSEEGIIIDCGARTEFQQTLNRVKQVLPPSKVTKIFANHQDPDVTASMIDWLELNPQITIITSPMINVLINHYIEDGKRYNFHNTEIEPTLKLKSGAVLEFIPSPFMHSPGAVTIYNQYTKTLFSGDIWSAISLEWNLVLDYEFEEHIDNMDMFHQGYISSNKACRYFLYLLKDKDIDHIMPQHGSIITQRNLNSAFKYIRDLKCGIDNFKDYSNEDLDFIT